MNRMLKVSILIPLYNSEKYIGKTIQSAINQTYPNIEIVIIDDGSTDNSFQLAKQFESGQVKVYHQTNKGASSARNLAFKYSTGDLIQYLDADDLLHPEKIELQVSSYLNYDHQTIISGTWGRFNNDIKDVIWEKQTTNKDYNNPINWLIDSWNGLGMAAMHSWLIPRYLIEKAGPWNESLSLNDDGDFFCRVLLQAESISFVPDSKVYYRSNIKTSLSQLRSDKAIMSELNSYYLYTKHCLAISDSTVLKRALANNYLHFINQYYNTHKHLTKIAEKYFYELEVGKMWPIGSKRFQQLAKIIGYKAALTIRPLLTK
ncbi:MAG: glycosyltransferase family 2 protein [Marinilabiliaceae bacterium]|nr:glycosyltransferase family 2 protein [Marinilabiliaceae bacterium]